jgi:hypothetical protein
VAIDPFSALQRSVFMSGRGFSYFAETPGLPLSLKCMSNGRALYRFDRREVAVDDDAASAAQGHSARCFTNVAECRPELGGKVMEWRLKKIAIFEKYI